MKSGMAIRSIVFAFIMSAIISRPNFGQNLIEDSEIYRIRAGDVLQIAVLEDPKFDRSLLVRPDGRISLPLVGTVVAEGRTPEELQDIVQSGLRQAFVVTPTVSVSLAQIAPIADAIIDEVEVSEIFIVGAVKAPGRYQVILPVSTLQALALAGGMDVFAAKQRVQIRRQTKEEEIILPFNYAAIEGGDPAAKDIQLQDGDIIVVPERGLFN